MDTKWPFMLIAFGLVFALGLTIASLERTGVMNNWDKRRCELPVAMAAMFFKPDWDPRSKNDFAKDNFDFCMKTYIDKFMSLLMAPINAIFGKHANLAGGALDMVNTIRKIAASMFNALLGFLDTYFRRFNASVFEMSRVMQYLRMAMRRANAVVVSMIYQGITMFRGMLNTIQFVIKVILIICGILLAIIIILIFVLFPFIPMILAVLGAIIATVLALVMVIAGTVANEASSDKSGFCFSETTKIVVKENDKEVEKLVSEIKIGDDLGYSCGKVSAVIQMNGKDVELFDICGVIVSGSHLVLGTDNIWKTVAKDERAKKVDTQSKILYCFNTSSHDIPIVCSDSSILKFREWEEIEDEDKLGQYTWIYTILKTLNNNTNYSKWKDGLKVGAEVPLMGRNIKIKTAIGFVELWRLSLFGSVLDRNGNEQEVLGIINAEIEGIKEGDGKWNTELYEMNEGIWVKGASTVKESNESACGMTLITETGEIIIWDEEGQKEKIVRDFTEIGHKEIHKTYPLVDSRLRLFRSPNEII
jgi:hypothetical protein